MTANSQLISVKLLQGIIKKGFQPLIKPKKNQGISLLALDGDFVKRLFDIVFFFVCAYYLVSSLFLLGDYDCH